VEIYSAFLVGICGSALPKIHEGFSFNLLDTGAEEEAQGEHKLKDWRKTSPNETYLLKFFKNT
jgi:hypothetical protein